MKSINNFNKEKIESSILYQIIGGRYKKSGCGTRDIGGGMVMEYKCDIYDDEGKKSSHYFGAFVHPE